MGCPCKKKPRLCHLPVLSPLICPQHYHLGRFANFSCNDGVRLVRTSALIHARAPLPSTIECPHFASAWYGLPHALGSPRSGLTRSKEHVNPVTNQIIKAAGRTKVIRHHPHSSLSEAASVTSISLPTLPLRHKSSLNSLLVLARTTMCLRSGSVFFS